MRVDHDQCLRAVQSTDARFDGWFYTGVLSTGIYCRPSCPARTPKPENMRFYPSSAAAQQAGFRACKRCRPDASPGSPEWNERADVVARAMRLIADGVVDREGVTGLARRLGYSVRQLERQLLDELGAGPLALARAQRAQTARVLIETSAMAMSDIAFAAGFASIRAFNDTVREVYAVSPTELRSRGRRPSSAPSGTLSLRLPYREPLEPSNLFGHLAATGIPGVEEWRDGWYRRTLRLPHGPGILGLRPAGRRSGADANRRFVDCQVTLSDQRDLTTAINRSRWLLDLDADPVAVDAALAEDPALAGAVHATPGRRVPRSVDPDEFALRAVLGQQVSTAAARTHAGRLAEALGEPVEDPAGGLRRLFPSVESVAGMDQADLRMPRTRQATVVAMADALATGRIDLQPGTDWQRARAALIDLPGVGPWTVEMIAMRALGDPDALPASDLGVLHGARACGLPDQPRGLTHRSMSWRPWRSYAVQHLWAALPHPVNQLPDHNPSTQSFAAQPTSEDS